MKWHYQFTVDVLGEPYKVSYFHGRGLDPLLKRELDYSKRSLCIDLETYANTQFPVTKNSGLLPIKSCIRTLQFFDGKSVCIFDFMSKGGNFLEMSEDGIRALQTTVLAAPTLIAHNALFETAQLQKYAYRHDCYKPLDIHCTMNMYRLVSHAVAASEDKRFFKSDLKTVAKTILEVDLEKDSQGSDWSQLELTQEQLEYCARDVIVPWKIYQLLMPKIEEFGLKTIFDLNTKAQEAVAHMNIHGIAIDTAKHDELIAEWEAKATEYKLEAAALFNQEIEDVSPEKIWEAISDNVSEEIMSCLLFENLESSDSYAQCLQEWLDDAKTSVLLDGLNRKQIVQIKRLIKNIESLQVSIDSSKQVGAWLERNLSVADLAEWPKTEKGSIKTDSFAFSEAEHLEVVQPLINYKKYAKLVSTYGKSFADWFVNHPDGTIRLHPNFTLCQTETGRMSSYEPNIQNIPSKGIGSELRRIFIPRSTDRTLVVADFSQIEIRAAAYLSGDRILVNAYDTEIDIHRLTAARTAGKPLDQVSDDERMLSKPANFCLLFLGGAQTLKKYAKQTFKIEMSLDHAKTIVNAFHQAYPEFYEWQMEQVRNAEETLQVTTPLGKTRRLLEDRYYNVCVNHPIQGAAAELMLLTLVFIMQELPEIQNVGVNEDSDEVFWQSAFLVNCVHDEVAIDCEKKDENIVKQLLQRSMERAMSVVFPDATHKKLVGIGSGENWLEAK